MPLVSRPADDTGRGAHRAVWWLSDGTKFAEIILFFKFISLGFHVP